MTYVFVHEAYFGDRTSDIAPSYTAQEDVVLTMPSESTTTFLHPVTMSSM